MKQILASTLHVILASLHVGDEEAAAALVAAATSGQW